MDPKELALKNSQAIDRRLAAVRDIVNNEKLTIQDKLTQLTAKLETNDKGICMSTAHNHNILGQCVGLSRVGALRAARLIGEEYANGESSIKMNIEKYATWLKS
jgi:hypothetical protein